MKVVGFVFMVVWVGGLCEVKTMEVSGLWVLCEPVYELWVVDDDVV